MRAGAGKTILDIYHRLHAAYGPQRWWPARTKTEIVVGAILTQNTAWTNVKRAIANLRHAKALSFRVLRDLPERRLAELIRPSGTYQVKAARLKDLVNHLWEHHDGSLSSLLEGELDSVRQRLLSIHGIGPETADAILLYAGHRPTFVIDAYTRRILRRHHVPQAEADYDTLRHLFQSVLPPDPKLYNQYHAVLVQLGKNHCRRRAICENCPLADLPHDADL